MSNIKYIVNQRIQYYIPIQFHTEYHSLNCEQMFQLHLAITIG